MADSVKRITASESVPLQKRCKYYMYQQAGVVFGQASPDTDDLLLAKALWAGQVKDEDMARIAMTNATIGGHIDADESISEAELEYVICTENKFHDLALAYSASGLIGV